MADGLINGVDSLKESTKCNIQKLYGNRENDAFEEMVNGSFMIEWYHRDESHKNCVISIKDQSR